MLSFASLGIDLAQQIEDIIATLENIDEIIAATRDDLQRVNDLKARADAARYVLFINSNFIERIIDPSSQVHLAGSRKIWKQISESYRFLDVQIIIDLGHLLLVMQ